MVVGTRDTAEHTVGADRLCMNNTVWQAARERAGLPDLHVHDLRHTVA